MAQKKKAGGAPPQAKRIATTGLSALALPDMPMTTTANTVVPGMNAGMGGAGFGLGMGFGNGMGSGMGGGGSGGGSGMTMFGVRGGNVGLVGTFYDLKQTRDRHPTDMASHPGEGVEVASPANMRYRDIVKRFVHSWNPEVLSKYYRADARLATPQIFIPNGPAAEAPKAFGVEKECEGRRWIIHYQADIVAPHSGRFRFIGNGDDMLVVRCNQRNVLDGCLSVYKVAPEANESENAGPSTIETVRGGKWIEMRAGEVQKLEVLIGECPGGDFANYLLIEEQGVEHPPGVYPVFQLRQVDVPQGQAVQHHGSIVFSCRPSSTMSSILGLPR
jgi:hypothetical protein